MGHASASKDSESLFLQIASANHALGYDLRGLYQPITH